MKTPLRARRCWAAAGLLRAVGGCAHRVETSPQAHVSAGKALGSFPYHPLVYHLDISILAYQLYGQTLVWPFDPYYEELQGQRGEFMAKVRAWAKTQGAEQARDASGLSAYRGPGVLGGFDDNPRHDPILYRYGHLDPWSNAVTNGGDRWIEYMTPGAVTGRIKDVYVCYRKAAAAEGAVALDPVRPLCDGPAPDAGDVLLAFEGGTGDKGEAGPPRRV